jgi:hypothetical protein
VPVNLHGTTSSLQNQGLEHPLITQKHSFRARHTEIMQRGTCCTISARPVPLIIQAKLEVKFYDPYFRVDDTRTFPSGTSTVTYNLYMSDEGECVAQQQHQPAGNGAYASVPTSAEDLWMDAAAPGFPELVASGAWLSWKKWFEYHQGSCPAGHSLAALNLVVKTRLGHVQKETVVNASWADLQQMECYKTDHVSALASAIARMVNTFRTVIKHNVVQRTLAPAAAADSQRSALITPCRSAYTL